MRYISELRDGSRIQDVYLVKHKQSAVTKNGRNYENVILQDKTGQLDAKIWDPNSDAIHEFDYRFLVISDDARSAGSCRTA